MAKRPAAAAIAALFLGIGLSACVVVVPPLPGGYEYVSIGDSYAAGWNIAPAATTGIGPGGCNQSASNYARLVQAAEGYASFADESCVGATAASAESSQLGRLGSDTAVVTVMIGGNDAGLAGVLDDCTDRNLPYFPGCRAAVMAKYGTDHWAAQVDAAGPLIEHLIAAIRAAAPSARVYLVGYPMLFPDAALCDAAAWWNFDWFQPDFGYAGVFNSMEYLHDLQAHFADVERAAAERAGAMLVDVSTASATHDACQNDSARRWVNNLPYVSNPLSTDGAPIHPTAAGSAAIAALVEGALGTP